MSDKTDKPGEPAGSGWVPSAEHPVPPTTEFQAVGPEPVEPIDAAEPDETPAEVTPEPAATPTPAADADATLPPETPATPDAAATATGAEPPRTEAPAWKTPAAAGLPPQWGDPEADAQATGPQPTNGVANLWGLAPEDRPEVALGAALAGGVLTAILFRTLARR